MKEKRVVIEISYKTIIFITLLVVFSWLVYQIRDVLFLFFVSLILMGAMNPSVEKMERRGFPRWLAILILYLFLVGIFLGILAGILPPLLEQTKGLTKLLPRLFRGLSFLGISQEIVVNQLGGLGSIPAHLFRFGFSLFSNLLTIVAVLVITFYLLLEHRNLDRYFFYLFGKEGRRKGGRIVHQLEKRLGGWVRGEVILMSFVALLSFLGFFILRLNFALVLALLAGLLEIVPTVGPVIAALPAATFGFSISPLMGAAVLAWCFFVQQVENNLLVPKIMKGAAGVNPVITLFSLAVGFKIAGVAGALLAIPAYITIEVVIRELFSSRK